MAEGKYSAEDIKNALTERLQATVVVRPSLVFRVFAAVETTRLNKKPPALNSHVRLPDAVDFLEFEKTLVFGHSEARFGLCVKNDAGRSGN